MNGFPDNQRAMCAYRSGFITSILISASRTTNFTPVPGYSVNNNFQRRPPRYLRPSRLYRIQIAVRAVSLH